MDFTLLQHFGIKSNIAPKKLGGYDSDNYLIEDKKGNQYIFKKHLEKDIKAVVEAECELIAHLGEQIPNTFQSGIKTQEGTYLLEADGHICRLVQYLEGDLLADVSTNKEIVSSLGTKLASMHLALSGKRNIAVEARKRYWDLQYIEISETYRPYLDQQLNTKLVDYFLQQYHQFVRPEIIHFRKSILHGDVNDYNLLIQDNQVSGIIDFGDITYGPIVFDLAIALSYLLPHQSNPSEFANAFIAAYHQQHPLEEKELESLYYLIALRCCQSILNAAYSIHQQPNNKVYINISQKDIWALLEKWITVNPIDFSNQLKTTCGFSIENVDLEVEQKKRDQLLSNALAIAPIKMDKAAFQYMYSADGKTYIDMRNNIPHVGHCHPKVVAAGQKQMAQLNTNTRYYYDSLHQYAEKLLSKFPASLNRVFFVNSGSAASDLAFRLATTVTAKDKIMGLEEGYHGNTFKAIEVSHYKYSHKGGKGQSASILKAPMPWDWKRQFGERAGALLAKSASQIIRENANSIAAFVAEPIVGCGGQLDLPLDYLKSVYNDIRSQGGLCISDEVQTGFARLGHHWWGFEMYDVIPDIVITGKCIGNGHPMAAVICTEEVANQFDNGMEFFSSFGGNPVSCEIGNAVIEVIEEENLKLNAADTGDYFIAQLEVLKADFDCIGDVRGLGFFLGIEFIKNGQFPDTEKCAKVKQALRDHLILLGSDGPFDNILKIKPPLCFTKTNVDEVIQVFRNILTTCD